MKRAQVLFDGDCPLCRRSIAFLKKLDWLGKLEFVNARDPDPALLDHPLLANAPLLEQMHLLTPDGGKVYQGFAAFRGMAWRLPLLWPLAPLLYIPGVPWVGQKIYLWVARNRFQLVPCHGGVCTIQKREKKEAARN